MPEARRREVDNMLRGLTPKHQRQLSISSSNALDSFNVIEAVLSHRKLVLLLDYDGTLTPIVNDPSKAVLSERVREILRELPKHFVTGVVSGRALSKIRSFVDVPGLLYAGSHGFDILAPSALGFRSRSTSPLPLAVHTLCVGTTSQYNGDSGTTPPPQRCCCGKATENGDQKESSNAPPLPPVSDGDEIPGASTSYEYGAGGVSAGNVLEEVRHQVAAEYLPVMSTIRNELIDELQGIDRAEVEDNRFSISIHYRNCARADVPKVRDVVKKVQSRHDRIRMGSGKEVLELQPDIAWDKGKAVLWLLDKLIIPVAEEAISTPTTSRTVATDTNKPKEGVTETPTHIAAAPGTNGAGAGVENMSSAAVDDSGRADEEGGFFTIFIGDDKTDENAFRIFTEDGNARSASHEGLGILVSEESRETNAAYTLRNPDEVALFLEKVAQFGSECRSTRR